MKKRLVDQRFMDYNDAVVEYLEEIVGPDELGMLFLEFDVPTGAALLTSMNSVAYDLGFSYRRAAIQIFSYMTRKQTKFTKVQVQ